MRKFVIAVFPVICVISTTSHNNGQVVQTRAGDLDQTGGSNTVNGRQPMRREVTAALRG
jgi:hypothetical protein